MGMPLLWGLASGLACFVGLGSFLGLANGPVNLIFQTLSNSMEHYDSMRVLYLHGGVCNFLHRMRKKALGNMLV